MIFVSGTKRSGTSLWMQILVASGIPHVGEEFPVVWGKSIRDANPHGFYESRFRQGVFYATNPDPKTGQFLSPKASRTLAVKVFIPGLIRSDLAYVYRVVATIRHWRAQCASLAKLYALEDAWLAKNPPKGKTGQQAVEVAQKRRGNQPLPVSWFLENYELIRDFSVRRYALNLSSYERLLEAPDRVIPKVMTWLGVGDVRKAMQAVDPALNRSSTTAQVSTDGLSAATLRVFDDLHQSIHEHASVPQSLAAELNETYQTLQKEYGRLSRERGREDTQPGQATEPQPGQADAPPQEQAGGAQTDGAQPS